jgi:hypothetical protein
MAVERWKPTSSATCWGSPIARWSSICSGTLMAGDIEATLETFDRLYADGAEPAAVLRDLARVHPSDHADPLRARRAQRCRSARGIAQSGRRAGPKPAMACDQSRDGKLLTKGLSEVSTIRHAQSRRRIWFWCASPMRRRCPIRTRPGPFWRVRKTGQRHDDSSRHRSPGSGSLFNRERACSSALHIGDDAMAVGDFMPPEPWPPGWRWRAFAGPQLRRCRHLSLASKLQHR